MACATRRRTRFEVEVRIVSPCSAFTSDRDINKVPLRQRVLSAPADAIHRTAAVRGRAYTADPRGRYRACDRPRAQHDACPCDAARRILDILALNDGACWFRRGGHEPAISNADNVIESFM